ncbi:ACBP-domain-containing protein [Tricholoma matsutake]|nr:ACBP-domain-containing protein [Tricholoma matsutake 945]
MPTFLFHILIDAQFDRAVEIVQGLPKTGPIQTDYEEKLTMYRPGMWDMLGRAKWDAWAKHKDVDPYEAKWLYVDALLKVLRKYSDKTVAMSLVQELEEYGGDPSNIALSRSFSKSPGSDSSGSTASDDVNPTRHPHVGPPLQRGQAEQYGTGSDQEDSEDETHELPAVHVEPAMSQAYRPESSLSSQRYRTPMTASLVMSPPPAQRIPPTQPLPSFETPSAFAKASPAPSTSYPPTSSSYVGQFSGSSRGETTTPTHLYHAQHQYSGQTPPRPVQYEPIRPASILTLEHAIENVQGHMAALAERLESLETLTNLSRSHLSYTPGAIGSPSRGRGSPTAGRSPHWDIDDLGLWSFVLNPLSHTLREFLTFFARNENRSPTSIVIRRLCLDLSFLVCVVAVVRALWRRSGVRRREVRAALVVLWRAILGTKPRVMIDQGV